MKRFDGKTAWWLWFLFFIYNLIPVAIVVFDKTFVWSVGTIIAFIACYLLNVVWLPILIIDWVDVKKDYFVLHYGFLKIRVNFSDILEVKKSHNPVATTANSFDRIYIKTVRKGFYLSLYKNDEFIELLNSKIKKDSKN